MAGTIFEGTKLALQKWFYALYLFSVSKNGVAARELERHLGVNKDTAWRMANKIRGSLKQGADFLKGVVEADEAYIGGRRRSSSNRGKPKTPLLGVVQRRGKVRVQVLYDSPTTRDVTDFIATNVLVGSVLHTDESPLYHRLAKVYDRHAVNHSRYEYVRGDDYSNTIEGFWGLFKPYLNGTHRFASKRWLQLYVNEAAWKYNHRNEQLFPLLLMAAVPSFSMSTKMPTSWTS